MSQNSSTDQTLSPTKHKLPAWCVLLILIVVQSYFPKFSTLDYALLDFYHQYFQFETPDPSKDIVHIHIDDQAIKTFGRWPWPRSMIADAVDEMNRAGAKLIVLDLLLDKPQPIRLVDSVDALTGEKVVHEVTDDFILAKAMKRAGNVLLAVHFEPHENLSIDVEEALVQKLEERFSHAYQQEYDKVVPQPPIEVLLDQAKGIGGVTIHYDKDGRVRRIPLIYTQKGHYYPHLALTLALRLEGIDEKDLEYHFESQTLRYQLDGKKRMIEMSSVDLPDMTPKVPITWPSGSTDWRLTYSGSDNQPRQQLNIGRLVELSQFRKDLAFNQQIIDRVILDIAGQIMPTAVEGYIEWFKSRYSIERLVQGEPLDDEKLKVLELQRVKIQSQVIEAFEHVRSSLNDSEDLQEEDRALKLRLDAWYEKIEEAKNANIKLQQSIKSGELYLKSELGGKAAIVGWTALGSIADFMPTSLHDKTPGSMIIGTMSNAIITDHMLRERRFLNIGLEITILTFIFFAAILLRPMYSLVTFVCIEFLFVFGIGWVVFDMGNILYYSSRPLVFGAVVWSCILVYRLLTEQRDKARITRQFSHYLAPGLVKLLVENPEKILRGQYELSCAFIDIEHFTEITDSLGSQQTVELLNQYLLKMTRHLMVRDAYVNKYLGDGILAVWGAPIATQTYARDATLAVLGCMKAVEHLNEDEKLKDMPNLRIRGGISTGPMMIDDLGAPPLRSDYTIIGTSVNLAARLEQLNKEFGTCLLINDVTNAYVQNQMLTRHLGLIHVSGIKEPQHVYELIELQENASSAQKKWARRTNEAVRYFIEGEFEQCSELWQQIKQESNDKALAEIYIRLCEQYISQPPVNFDGSITLTHQ